MARRDTTYTDAEVGKSISEGAMVFLGTPHRGSDNGAKLHAILSTTIRSKEFIEELKHDSLNISSINEDFRHYAKGLTLWSLYENRPTSIGPGRSAVSHFMRWRVSSYHQKTKL